MFYYYDRIITFRFDFDMRCDGVMLALGGLYKYMNDIIVDI
jgi:hypothetical protein